MMKMKLIVVERGTWMVNNTVLMDTSGLTGQVKERVLVCVWEDKEQAV